MAYSATVINVMIASPGDVHDERNTVRRELLLWNAINSEAQRLVFQPFGWEVQAAPDLSGRPQELINQRLLDKCDLLVGVFWTRLGTPTGEHESGTVEEIKEHVTAGRPAMVYFSSRPVVPGSYRDDQYSKVIEFKEWCQQKGITNDFETIDQFEASFRTHLPIILRDNPYLRDLLPDDVDATPIEPKTRTISFSAEAIDLLRLAAKDENGTIMRAPYIGGTHFQAGQTSIDHNGTRRAIAKIEADIEMLENYGLIQDVGFKREIFEVTQAGFDALDEVEQRTT